MMYVNNCIYGHESVIEFNNQIATFGHVIMLIMKLYVSNMVEFNNTISLPSLM